MERRKVVLELSIVRHTEGYAISTGYAYTPGPPGEIFGVAVVPPPVYKSFDVLHTSMPGTAKIGLEAFKLSERISKAPLWREFSKISLEPSERGPGIIAFAEQYGFLRSGLRTQAQEDLNPSNFALNPDPLSNGPYYSGEEIILWLENLTAFKALGALWDALRLEKIELLRNYLQKEPVWDKKTGHIVQYRRVFTMHRQQFSVLCEEDAEDTQVAYTLLRQNINVQLEGNLRACLLPDLEAGNRGEGTSGAQFYLILQDLKTALWYSFAQEVAGNPELRECQNPRCKVLFEPTDRRDKYCASSRCGQQARKNPTGQPRGRPPKDKSVTPVSHSHPESSLP